MTQPEPQPGEIVWTDLTVRDAPRVAEFYEQVVGWRRSGVAMGDYEDWAMLSATGKGVAGVCHARGINADVPPQWLVYIQVADLDRSCAHCRQLGGEVLVGPRPLAGKRFAVIRDPAGAVCALFGV